jgi:hypothetical protein
VQQAGAHARHPTFLPPSTPLDSSHHAPPPPATPTTFTWHPLTPLSPPLAPTCLQMDHAVLLSLRDQLQQQGVAVRRLQELEFYIKEKVEPSNDTALNYAFRAEQSLQELSDEQDRLSQKCAALQLSLRLCCSVWCSWWRCHLAAAWCRRAPKSGGAGCCLVTPACPVHNYLCCHATQPLAHFPSNA